jgi:hypothetical protein
MKGWIIAIILIALVFAYIYFFQPQILGKLTAVLGSSNTAISLPALCKPNYIQLGATFTDYMCNNMYQLSLEECCRIACYNAYKVTSYKTESISCGSMSNVAKECVICKCDVNNCNPTSE